MSDKIKSKDLQYDSSLPPFLQKLHNQNGGRGDGDRHERAIARPKKAKDPSEDDGPTIIDETGETVSKDELEKLASPGVPDTESITGQIDPNDEPKVSGALPNGEPSRTEQKTTDGTAQKKRKVAKVVGGNEDDDAESKDQKSTANKIKKKVKKAKPIKLAFDEDEGS